MGFMLGSMVSRSNLPLYASRVYVNCPSPCHHVKNTSWALYIKKEIYFNVKYVFYVSSTMLASSRDVDLKNSP